ncbi:hypothetical protein JF55_05475 [Pseudomonas sp. 1-7]|nr:hypothetical protein JF55_05475 [Pseudomonas sp. 1-7]
MNIGAARRFEHGIAVIAVGFVTTAIGPHVARVQQLDLMAERLRQAPPVMCRTTGFHHPLDRLGLLLYISPERLSVQPLALHHLAESDTLGNLVNGLGQINSDALHNDSPAQKTSTSWYRTVVWGESITAFKSFASLTGTG